MRDGAAGRWAIASISLPELGEDFCTSANDRVAPPVLLTHRIGLARTTSRYKM
jgi:hypothetical protein